MIEMNDLGNKILGIMERSQLGDMSIHVLSKQTTDIGITLDSITLKDVMPLVDKLDGVLPFFLGKNANNVIINIRKLGDNGGAVI